MKKILVLGATGAMGKYLVPLLASQGCQVDAVALDKGTYDFPNVNNIQADTRDFETYKSLVNNNYDGIVDFLIYPTNTAAYRLPFIADSCGHYIYLSTYRVYDNKELPVKESSPRIFDTGDDPLIRYSDDYCIYKARGEEIIKLQQKKNWTIIRPAITYSYLRNQLVTLEAHDTVGRARSGKTVVLPEQARKVQGTMSWAGDVAKMIAGILLNDKAIGETYTVSTAEHHTWEEIADYYKDICNMKVLWVDKEEFISIMDPFKYGLGARWQLEYDRLFDRVMDNSKILALTGMKQDELMPLYEGLKYEISRIPENFEWRVRERMDAFLAERNMK